MTSGLDLFWFIGDSMYVGFDLCPRFLKVRSSNEYETFQSGKRSLLVPSVGQEVYVRCNSLGPGTVESYFIEHGYVGVAVRLSAAPEWHKKQTKGTKWEGVALVFGNEITV